MARTLLSPLVPLYRLALGAREVRLRLGLEPVRQLRWPVVSIGNLSAGGAGKTPLTIALAKALREYGQHVDVLSRGYGRKTSLAAKVEEDGQAQDFGDEPLVIAREARVPVYVARQRYEAGVLAESEAPVLPSGGAVHLLDDGFQHRQLTRALDIVLLSRRDRQDRLLPAGNLREPLSALCRATVLAIPAEDAEFESDLRGWGWQGPVWRLHRTMHVPCVAGPAMAFCGIARPEQFYAGVEEAGVHTAARRSFADHFAYDEAAVRQIVEQGRSAGATAFLTTAKDAARLGPLAWLFPAESPLVTVGLRTEIAEQEKALDWLLQQITLSNRA